METENRNKLVELFNDNTTYMSAYLDFNYVLNSNDINNIEELEEYMTEQIYDIEIMYYSNAIDILKEEDQSLMESIEIAYEYGCDLKNLNSEILASLLIQNRCFEELSDFMQEVEKEEIFEEN